MNRLPYVTSKIRQALETDEGMAVCEISRQLGIAEQTLLSLTKRIWWIEDNMDSDDPGQRRLYSDIWTEPCYGSYILRLRNEHYERRQA